MIPDLLAHAQDVPHIHGVTVGELVIAAAGGAAIWIAVRIHLSNLAHRRR